MRWTLHRQAQSLRKTTGEVADGEIVWSWRPDAGAKLAMMLRITPMTVARKPGSPAVHRGERDISCKTIAQGRPDIRPNLWLLARIFFHERGPRARPAPGLPCALQFEGAG
jgi:hypothetical protein